MSIHLMRDLESLHRSVLSMCASVEELVTTAVSELGKPHLELSVDLEELDDEIDRWDVQIEEDCLKILALHQPVAVDLRRITSVLKISGELERVADLAVNISERAQGLAASPEVVIPDKLRDMATAALEMLHHSIDAFVELDGTLARKVCARDDYVDRLNREIIEDLIASMDKVKPTDDAKLQHLLAMVRQKVDEPLNPGNRKVLVFTAFADTANYLFDNLAPFAQQLGLHVAKVTGSDAPKTTLKKSYDFQSVLTLFSPRSKEKAIVLPNEPGELDILIGTDCISEGQNLQDCDFLINYDIHWNPVRIIQRFGRIDRIGSQNAQIQLVNYWPDITLDEYINLKERVENRMVIADVTATGDDNVLTAKSSDIAYRKEQLKRLQDEVIELEDVKAGISITDLGLNDFRMDLLNYVKEHGELDNVPFGMHAVVPAQPKLGLQPGVIFALKNIHDSVNVNQQNRLHPFYLVYIDDDGRIVADHTEVKRLLDLIRSSCKGRIEPIRDVCRIFNERTEDGRKMDRHSDLLSSAIRSMIEVKEEKDIDSLFSGGRTTALTHTIKGLDDFELIAFLVIEGGGA